MRLWNFLKTGHWDSKTKRIAKEKIKSLTNYMVARLEATMDYYKNNKDENFHFEIIASIDWVKDTLKGIVNKSDKGSKLTKSIIKFQENSGLETWDKDDDQKNYLREDNVEKRTEILEVLFNGPEKSDKFYPLWNKKIKNIFKNIYDLFIKKIKGNKEIIYLNFDQKLEKALAPIKFDSTCTGWAVVVISEIFQNNKFQGDKEHEKNFLIKIIGTQALLELFYLLKGKYPEWSDSLIKIRGGGGDDWTKNLDNNKKNEFIKIVTTGSNPKYSDKIKKIFCKLSIKEIKSRFEKHFRKNPDERGLAKKRIGWFLLSDQEKSEIPNDFY